jgi:carbon-monoxide dehydrogenase medium subunit
MKDFEFHRPTTIKDAVGLVRDRGGAKFLAGGQSLLPVLKLELAEPSDLVSLTQLAELRDIRVDGNNLLIGALVTHDEVSRSAVVQKAIPALAALAGAIGDAQVRNRGTLGGSVAHADPAADHPAALLGLGATVSMMIDRRRAFFTGLFMTDLGATAVKSAVPDPQARRAAKLRTARRSTRWSA